MNLLIIATKAMSHIADTNKDILFAIIQTKLTDNARSLASNRRFENWDELKNHLIDTYSEKRTMGQWQLQLNSCHQN